MSGSIENLGWLQKYTGLEPKDLEKLNNPSEIDESVFTKIGIEVKDEIDQGETSQLALHASGFDVDQEKMDKAREVLTKELKKQKLSPEELENKMQTELSKIQNVKTRVVKLDWQEEIALTSIDALKEELV